jgi:hypothetical protein
VRQLVQTMRLHPRPLGIAQHKSIHRQTHSRSLNQSSTQVGNPNLNNP